MQAGAAIKTKMVGVTLSVFTMPIVAVKYASGIAIIPNIGTMQSPVNIHPASTKLLIGIAGKQGGFAFAGSMSVSW